MTMRIQYSTGVKTPAGWRQVEIVANASFISTAMVIVEAVETIDGEKPAYGQSRTGAKRQQFNGLYFAQNQVGAKKRLSSCIVL
jgi:hypothetical protein